MEHSIKERCHVNTNIYVDTFVGIKCIDGDISVNFPLGFHVSDDEKELRRDILLLLKTLSLTIEKEDSTVMKVTQNFDVDGFPIQAYLYVISDYYNRGYYKEREIQYQINNRGKINWSKTIKTQSPFIQGAEAYYTRFVTRKNPVNENELITLIHEYCVYESFCKMGWLFTSTLPLKPRIKLNKKMFKAVIMNKYTETNNDKNKALFKNMLAIIDSLQDSDSPLNYQYGIDNSDHINLERVKRNVYWDCYNGIRSASVTGKEDEIVDSFEEVEQLFYKIHYQDYVEGQNARNLKNHHPERNRTTDDIRTHKKTCPEETIYQIGTKDDYVDPDVLLTIVTEFITELSDRFGEHFHLLNWSLHLDESTPHIHERHVFDCKNAYGEIFPQQEKALETLGFELPNPEKKAGRFNNRKMAFDATCRILLFDICKKHGLELEEEPSHGGREYLEKQDYIRMKQKKDIASLEESIQSQIEVVNQKKYEVFEQEVQYKENSIKIIDQEKKLKAQSEEFFDNAERILQQDETMKQLEFKIEDVEKLIDDVTDEVYEKAVERIADEIEIATRKEDIKLVVDSKKWVLNPERKASKREKQYALDRLDGVIKKIEYAITKTISKMKNRLLKPENKNIMVQEIKKEVKPSILKKLSEKKASITRNGETGKLNKESSLDNER